MLSNKIYAGFDENTHLESYCTEKKGKCQTEYIRKDALLDYLQKELERLWELIPDASNEAPTQMEMRYLGEYMATERLIDEIKPL